MSALPLAVSLACTAWAEDQSDLSDHGMLPGTVLYVDVLDPVESFVFEAEIPNPAGGVFLVEVDVFEPDGDPMGRFASGSVIPASDGIGTYRLEPVGLGDLDGVNGTDPMTTWAIEVLGASPLLGRVWSPRWVLNGGGYGVQHSLSSSFFAVVPAGAPDRDAVVELRTEGLAGFVYSVLVNDVGVSGAGARSVPAGSVSIPNRFPLYLRPPEGVVVDPVVPTVGMPTQQLEVCGSIAPGAVPAEITFSSDVVGTWHLVCDTDGLQGFDPTSDAHAFGEAEIGDNQITFDGTLPDSRVMPIGTWVCEIWLTTGDLHYLAQDIETSFEGVRLFELDAAGSRSGLPMFWDDGAIQSSAVPMPDGQTSFVNSGPLGLSSGDPGAGAEANLTGRAWGDFTTAGKGDGAVLDTWTWIHQDVALLGTLEVIDGDVDSDSDGLVDAAETCLHNTDPDRLDTDGDGLTDLLEVESLSSNPNDADSDDDGVGDAEETSDPTMPLDSDGDGLPDSVDADDDGDGYLTLFEGSIDSDGDGVVDFLDRDDDGDGVPTANEAFGDSDGDGAVDRLDIDDDGDGVLTEDEDRNGDGNARNDDADADQIPDFLDDDDDGDGIPTSLERPGDSDGDGVDDILDPDDDDDGVVSGLEGLGDLDGDGVVNYLDDDDDGDGIPTLLEDSNGNGDWSDDDADSDSIPDFLELDDDGDGVATPDEDRNEDGVFDDDTDGDGLPDYLDPDDDGDGLPTADEMSGDTDGDGVLDVLDPDDDGDGVPTLLEGSGDVDGDGIPNHLDTDADGDGRPDGSESLADTDFDGAPDFLDADDDGDGVSSFDEGTSDFDGDGVIDSLDADDDDDGVPTIEERSGDTDGDGQPDRLDVDDDGDGISTMIEQATATDDFDGDGAPNWVDLDSDGDGRPDADEGTGDLDGDGRPDYLDPDGALETAYRGSGVGCSSATPSPFIGGLWLGLLLVRRRGISG